MRDGRALARDTPAAPSRIFQLFNERIFQNRERGARPTSVCPVRAASVRPAVDAKYSTARIHARQHLFFPREHHAGPKQAAPRVVNPDREQPFVPVEQEDVVAVAPPARLFARAYGRAVAHPARLFAR